MTTLPIDEALPALRAQLARRAAVVLQAPPGAGKTTAVPLALLAESWLAGRTIVMLEPRRLAARAAAARMAEMLGEAPGATVGFRIRFEARVSNRTRIEVLTEGILTRRLQGDPGLEGVGLVIFDEFHERHLQTDLALALTRDAQRVLRPDLKILVMSATLDAGAVSRLLDAPLVTGVGRSFPVDVRYLGDRITAPLPERVSAAVAHALAAHDGDVLAFLPGAGEIRRTQRLLDPQVGDAVDVCPLYGELPWEQQDRALRPAARRKVILATPIAETSLTIDGVCVVVDGGFARVPQFDPRSGLTRLVTVRCARASADQRAGRAGRLAPGVCYRLWNETVQRGLAPQPTPEIRSADLASLVLESALWGTEAGRLEWIDPPPPAALAQARDLLMQLDALDAAGRITDTGRSMAALPLHPRLAHMVRAAETLGLAGAACDVAALVSERDVLQAERRRSTDIAERLEVLWSFRSAGRQAAAARGADPGACARVDQAARQWRRLANAAAAAPPAADAAGALLALAYPDRVGQQRAPHAARYLLASGRGARLPASDARGFPPYVVAAQVDAGEGEALIHLAAGIRLDELRKLAGTRISVESIVRWDDATASVVARREERLGKLVLGVQPLDAPPPAQLRAAMIEGIRRMGLQALPWTEAARGFQARVLSLRHWFPAEGWPDVSDDALSAALDTWLGPALDNVTRREHLAALDLLVALRRLLDWRRQQLLDESAPTHVAVPSGTRVPLQYVPGQPPVLAVKLQELFGLADTPRIAGGRVPVLLHLLSPARRPIQVTQDLRGFWASTYAQVRKELKGRYPKHPWPEDPWSAQPTGKAMRRRR